MDRVSTPPAQRRPGATAPPGPFIVALCVALVGWTTWDVLHDAWWVSVDKQLSEWVRDIGIRETFWPKVGVYAFTQFGARGTIVAIFAPFVAVVAWRRRTWQPVLRFVTALALLTVVIYAFKYGVGRTAPAIHQVHAGAQSYPSGHVPNAVLMWGLMAWLAVEYDLPERVRRFLGLMRYLAPTFTCVAMLLLDYHWLTDLTVGLALGVVLLRVLHAIFDGRLGQWGNVAGVGESDAGRAGVSRGTPDVAASGAADVVR